MSARFDGKSSNLDFDNSKYSIDLYLIPKNAGTSNIEVFFEDDSNELIKKYLYSIIIDNDYNVTYNLLEEKCFFPCYFNENFVLLQIIYLLVE